MSDLQLVMIHVRYGTPGVDLFFIYVWFFDYCTHFYYDVHSNYLTNVNSFYQCSLLYFFCCCSCSKRQYYYNKSYCNFLLPISVGICQYFVVEWQDAIGVKILLKVQFLDLLLDLILLRVRHTILFPTNLFS